MTELERLRMESAVREAFLRTIAKMGIAAFRATSLFGSNERPQVVRLAA